MTFVESRIEGAYLIEQTPHKDERGWFARSWCRRAFSQAGLEVDFHQSNISFNRQRGTLRGLHFQRAPKEEAKLVLVASGAIFDVIVDMRPDSPTVHQWQAFELSLENHRMLYIPEGVAHGYQLLEDNTTVVYQMTEYYSPEEYGIARWDDPAFGIEWPITPPPVISDQDANAAFEAPSP